MDTQSEVLRPSSGERECTGKEDRTPSHTLSVVIPALNEEDGIADIVRRIFAVEAPLKEAGVDELEVIVVDDGSRDRTPEIVGSLPGTKLIRHPCNLGYGAAIKTGFRNSQGSLLAFLDADGTYPPECLPALCSAAIRENADVAVGSRRSGARSDMPAVRRLGNYMWSRLVSTIGHSPCADPASGMRVLRRTVLAKLYPLPDGLNFTPVMSMRCMHETLKLVELPIPYSERQGRSKLSVVRDGTRFLKTILWTSLEYNPVNVFGIAGLLLLALSGLIGLGLVLARLRGITSLGYWGVASVFMALVGGVAGVSIYSLGVTFSFLVGLFHRRPLRNGFNSQGTFIGLLERSFGWVGIFAVGAGIGLTGVALILGSSGWQIARLWLWLLGGALFFLVGMQLLISWIVARVMAALSEREALINGEMQPENNAASKTTRQPFGKTAHNASPG